MDVKIAASATDAEIAILADCIAKRITMDVKIAASATDAEIAILADCIAKRIMMDVEIVPPVACTRSRTTA
jgi:hypothetical protein